MRRAGAALSKGGGRAQGRPEGRRGARREADARGAGGERQEGGQGAVEALDSGAVQDIYLKRYPGDKRPLFDALAR